MNRQASYNVHKILTHWGLEAYKWDQIKDVFKVKTNRGLKNLKMSPLNIRRLLFVHQAILHLLQNNFSYMYPILPTQDGHTFICTADKAFSLFDWIEGRQCDFGNPNELGEAGKILADFHLKSVGFTPPPNSNMRNQIGKCLQHFEERYQDLLNYTDIAHHSPDDRFAQIYLANLDHFLPMAERAIAKLKQSNYPQLVNQALANRSFCHGDPAARNFILTPQNQTFLIDFDSCRLDLPIMDLIKFTRRVLKKYNWSYPTAKFLIDAYQNERVKPE